ncbi:MAG: D-aminoacyl-tRNA deacylase [Nitriliruptoraceae bacterium]
MRALIQRVSEASVSSAPDRSGPFEEVGRIGRGLVVLVGVTHDDDPARAERLAERTWRLRVFEDADGVANLSAQDLDAELLVVSQFTLYADTRKGRRPSYVDAARPEVAEPLVDQLVERLVALGAGVVTGRFGTAMRVHLVNDGPWTVSLEV